MSRLVEPEVVLVVVVMVDDAGMDVVERVEVEVDAIGTPVSSIRLSSPGSYGSSASASRLGEYGSASLPGEYGSESSSILLFSS